MSDDEKTKDNKNKDDKKTKKRTRKDMDDNDNKNEEPPKKKPRRSNRLKKDENKPRKKKRKRKRIFLNEKEDKNIDTNDNNPKKNLDDFFSIILQGPFLTHPSFSQKKEEEIIEINEEDKEEGQQEPEVFINDINMDKLKTLDGLFEIIKTYENVENKDIKILISLKDELQELKDMVGMKDIKDVISSQIVYLIQKFDKTDMMHSVIQGPPGCGKTTLAKILAKIYLKLGYVKNNKFIIAKRSDLIAGYLGQTAIKTQKIIDKADGGVLFIDEAYSLGTQKGSNGDSFSKECIDTLNQNLSENKNFICIIAGYKKELKECFFKNNEGLERRFPWKFEIKKVNAEQLKHIFISMIRKNNWLIDNKDIPTNFFKHNRECFPFNGGSIETFFGKVKMIHSKRVFGKSKKEKMKITKEDIENAIEIHKKYEMIDDIMNNNPPFGMYL